MSNATQSKNTRINPRNIIGGIFEAIDDTYEMVTGKGTYVNEGQVEKQDFEEIQKSPELQVNKSMPGTGSIVFNVRWNQELSQKIDQATSEKNRKEALKARRAEVNQKIGISNLSYEDTVSEDFVLRADVQADLDRANSELSKEQLKAKKENTIASAKGINRIAGADMNRNFEDQNMQSPG